MIKNWIDRVLRRFGYWRWPERNGIKDTDAVARGMRWMAFYNEPNGLRDAFENMRRAYFERASKLKPDDVHGLLALSLADRVIAEVDGYIRAVIVEGESERQRQEAAERIKELPEPMRRRL